MSKGALLSILTMYNHDSHIFDNFMLPEGLPKEDVTNNLLMELAELEVIYTNPDMMKAAIGFWSKKELPVWTKLYHTTQIEYNPIWNQFRTEEWTDTQTRNLSGSNNQTRNLSGSDNETRNLTGSNNQTRNLSGSENETRDLAGTKTHDSTTTGTTTNNGTDTQKEYVSGFNENTPTLAKQTETMLGTGNTVGGTVESDEGTTDTGTVNKALTDTGTVNNSITDTGTVNKALTDTGTVNNAITDTGTVENAHTATFEGHTGIVPVQTLLDMERQTAKFNMINYIIDSFKARFCIMIY